MALFLGPAVSINRFEGGYKSISDYTDLADTESSDCLNVVYGRNGDIDKRKGSERLLNERLYSTSSTATGEPITGHFHFVKFGSTQSYHVVCAGDGIFNYTTATANQIATGLTDNSETYFTFAQVRDPKTNADDVIIAANGIDAMRIWNGTASMTGYTQTWVSASQVPIGKYLLSHKDYLYVANITDNTDASAPLKVVRSAVNDPAQFPDFFYLGGSPKTGGIQGIGVLNDQIIIPTRNSFYKYNQGVGASAEIQEVQGAFGVLAPRSFVNCGDFFVFLGDRGLYAYDGTNFLLLSQKVNDELFTDANLARLKFSQGIFDRNRNQYILYFASGDSSRNNRALIYDLDLKIFQPPVTGRSPTILSSFYDSHGIQRILYGDYFGYLYQDWVGHSDGLTTGYNDTVSSATYSTLTASSVSFKTTGDGLSGQVVRIVSGLGVGQSRFIASNTGTTLTLETDWGTPPDATSQFTVGGIDAFWRSKDYDFGGHDITKIFRHTWLRLREEGNFNITMHYIVNFKSLEAATSKDLLLLENGMAWGLGLWGQTRWGAASTIRKKVSLRNTSLQSTTGTHFAVRFANGLADQPFRVSGFDIELKAIGKR